MIILGILLSISSCICANNGLGSLDTVGYFWHVSDFHVDQNYSRIGNPENLCHPEDGREFSDNGAYGNFLCDSPQDLVNVTVAAMKKIKGNPDFIIWTGDNLPHTHNADALWDVTYEAIANITDLLTSSFPGVAIVTCIGNHDTYPANDLPPVDSSGEIYKGFLEKGKWNKLLPRDQWDYFLKGGYFSQVVHPGLRIISVNTILWYTSNTLTETDVDPSDQFIWLEECLKNCSLHSQKVFIIGHVPPGFYNRGSNPGLPENATFHVQYLHKYVEILNQYSEIIQGQMYGHYHMDMFQVFQYNTGHFKGSALIASSVTPWHSPRNTTATLAVYPSIRLMHYSRSQHTLLDYDQYFFNITTANRVAQSQRETEKPVDYEKLYTFTESYGVSDLTTPSLVQVYENLKRNHTFYDLFFLYLTAGKVSVDCDKICEITQLCAMSCSLPFEYEQCMKNVGISDNMTAIYVPRVHHSVNPAFIYGSIILVIVIGGLMFFVYRKVWQSRRRNQYSTFLPF